MADIDADGNVDLISGSWPGEIFLFKGQPGHAFAAPVKIESKEGRTINIGGGIQKRNGNMLLIAGDARYEQTDEGQVIVYEGERIKIDEDTRAGITGTASSVNVTDWDADGDFDLLVGDIRGNVWLVPNEGTAKAYAFGKEKHVPAGGRPLRVDSDAGPFAVDWDGDGDLDLLVGTGNGSVMLYRNTGSRKAPALAKGETLVGAARFNYGDPPLEPTPGMRTKVCAADWNGDGRLDLLVGDYTQQKPKPVEYTAGEKAEHERLRDEQSKLQKRSSEIYREIGFFGGRSEREKLSREKRKKRQKELSRVHERMTEIREKLPKEVETHGWVWLYLRRPSDARADGRFQARRS